MNANLIQKNIPNGWQKTNLGSIADLYQPQTISKSQMSPNGEYLVFGANGVIGKYSKFNHEDSEVIVTCRGASCGSISMTPKRAWITGNAMVIKVDEKKVLKPYIYYFLKNSDLSSVVSGGAQPQITRQPISAYKILFPESKTEQQKIAEILGVVDEDIERTQGVIEATEKLKRGLMQQLFTSGIGHTKLKKTKLGEIPEEWSDLTMEDVCVVRQGLQIPISERFKEAGNNRYKYLTIKYLRDAHLSDVAEYIENPPKGVICKSDDILMTRTGNTGKVITGVEGVFHNNFFLVDYNRNKIDRQFFAYYLNSNLIQKMIKVRAGSTTIPDLNHGDFYSLPLALPQKPEQQKIAGILSVVDEKISINIKLKEKLFFLKKGLMQDLLSGRVRVMI